MNNAMTDLAIVIPHSGRLSELVLTLESLRNQGDGFVVVVSNMGEPISSIEMGFPVSVINTPGAWGVGKARNIGAAHLNAARLFFLDCDITVPAGFVVDAMRKIGPGRGWAPIVRNSHSRYNANAGGWRVAGYGNIGVCATDFAATGGFDEFGGWGDEDTLFHRKCQQLGVRLARAHSRLVHRDHPPETSWHKQKTTRHENQEARKAWQRLAGGRHERE